MHDIIKIQSPKTMDRLSWNSADYHGIRQIIREISSGVDSLSWNSSNRLRLAERVWKIPQCLELPVPSLPSHQGSLKPHEITRSQKVFFAKGLFGKWNLDMLARPAPFVGILYGGWLSAWVWIFAPKHLIPKNPFASSCLFPLSRPPNPL
jgi:hypothetical protein